MAVSSSRCGHRATAVALTAFCLLAGACGKKGNPLPPARTIPNPTKDLTAAQRGNQLVLRFAYPQTTTAGAKLPGLAAVEVWVMPRPLPPGAKDLPPVDIREFTAVAKSVATLSGPELTSAVEGGTVVVRLPLPEVPAAVPAPAPSPAPAPVPSPAPSSAPAAEPTAPRSAFVYAIRTVAAEGERSAWSNLATLVPQPPPPPPTGLRIEPRARGIELSWQAPAGAAGFVVYRRQAASRAYGEPLATLPADAQSHVDETARYGERYIYTVTALGAREPRVESGFGEESEVDYADRFPPAPPPDLEALPQQGGVNLVWRPSSDVDTVGYVVYRQDEGGEWRRITPDPLADLKYADANLASGRLFRYRVTAVDAAGNEGSPTPELEVRPR